MDIDRQADLHYAFQFGQDFVRTGDPKVTDEFAGKIGKES